MIKTRCQRLSCSGNSCWTGCRSQSDGFGNFNICRPTKSPAVFLPSCCGCADEELGPVGVRSSVGHGQVAWSGVLYGEVLIFELVAIDGLSTGSVVVGEVAALETITAQSEVKRGAGRWNRTWTSPGT